MHSSLHAEIWGRVPYQALPLVIIRAAKLETWDIAVRRGSYTSLFLLNSGRFSAEKKGNSVLNFGSLKNL